MQVNESPLDRVIRLILGGALLTYGLYGLGGLTGSTAGIVAAVFGGIFVFTGITGFCALYKVLGINTNKKRAGLKSAKKAA